MAREFKCASEPQDSLEVSEWFGAARLYQQADVVHLSVEDAKALRKELKKIIKEIESNGNQPA